MRVVENVFRSRENKLSGLRGRKAKSNALKTGVSFIFVDIIQAHRLI